MSPDQIKVVRACIAWLHQRATEMNDPHAKGVLNSAAFALGTEKQAIVVPAQGDGEWRETVRKACDILAERIQGHPARSPGHNTRLLLEGLLAAPAPPAAPGGWQTDGGQTFKWHSVDQVVPAGGYILVGPTNLDGVPEVWSAEMYHLAKSKTAREPGWKHLIEEANLIRFWAPIPPLPQDETP